MKNNLCFTIASVLTFIVLANVISATITVGTIPELSMTGNSFRFDVSSNGIENITISADPIIQGSQQITFIPTTIEITTAGETKQAIINYTINNFDFQFGKKYSKSLSISGTTSGTITPAKTISFAVNEDYCEELDEADGDLSVTIEEINNNGLGEENEWLPLDEIEVEVNVEAGDYDVKNIELEWGLYNTATQKWVIDGSENDFTLKEGKDKTIVISFTLDENIDELETGSFKFYVRASGKIDADSGDVIDGKKTCVSTSDSIDIIMESDFVVVSGLEFSENISCGADLDVQADVWNIGDNDQDAVSVLISNSDLKVSQKIEVGDINALDSEQLSAVVKIPENAKEGVYYLEFKVYDEDGDLYENEYDNDKATFLFPFTIKGSCSSASDVAISASLVSGGEAGKELIIKSVISNTGSALQTYTLNVKGSTAWASSVELDKPTIAIASGQSQEVLITFDVNKGIEGDQSFTLEVSDGTNVVASQPVSVSITKSGFAFFDLGNKGYLWIIGALNILLVVVIIFVAIRIAKN